MHDLPDPIKRPTVPKELFAGEMWVRLKDHEKAVDEMADAVWDKAYKLCGAGMTVAMVRRWIWNYWQVPKGEEKA